MQFAAQPSRYHEFKHILKYLWQKITILRLSICWALKNFYEYYPWVLGWFWERTRLQIFLKFCKYTRVGVYYTYLIEEFCNGSFYAKHPKSVFLFDITIVIINALESKKFDLSYILFQWKNSKYMYKYLKWIEEKQETNRKWINNTWVFQMHFLITKCFTFVIVNLWHPREQKKNPSDS